MKKLITILLIGELFIAYFVLAPTCILRRAQVRAFAAWHDNPTPETRAELERQKRITELQSLGFSGVVFGVMGGATLIVALYWRRRRIVHIGTKDEAQMDQPTAPGNSR
jgi:hypothetical protein